ncbi:MAG: hypothetical protein ACRC28_04340 [Clostridium sp.]|uniref:hypothetical protein n=1 Tax=Clostridium sp. TaxID=1506 RepID=UPI003F33192E
MVIKYKNDIEDLVDLNIFIGSISFKRWILNNILPIVYTIVTLGLGVWLINRYGGLEETNRLLIFVLIVCNIFIWIRVTVFKRKTFRKSLSKMVEKNPAYIQRKEVRRREKDFFVQNLEDKKKTSTFKIENISRVIKKGEHIFMLKKDNSPMLMIPVNAFKNENDLEIFFKGFKIKEY